MNNHVENLLTKKVLRDFFLELEAEELKLINKESAKINFLNILKSHDLFIEKCYESVLSNDSLTCLKFFKCNICKYNLYDILWVYKNGYIWHPTICEEMVIKRLLE